MYLISIYIVGSDFLKQYLGKSFKGWGSKYQVFNSHLVHIRIFFFSDYFLQFSFSYARSIIIPVICLFKNVLKLGMLSEDILST